jgi:hypothetical protein
VVERAISGRISIYPNDRGDWVAAVEIRRATPSGVSWREYYVRDLTDADALAALRKAVARGEEGWSW